MIFVHQNYIKFCSAISDLCLLYCINMDNKNVLRFQIIFFFLNKTIQFFLQNIQNVLLLYIILYKEVLR